MRLCAGRGAEQIADIIFSVDKNIRYVGIIDPSPSYEVRLSPMREGVNSLTPEHGDREFLRTIPETILNMCKSQERDLSNVRHSLLCFHRLTLMFFRTQEYVIVMGLEAGTFATPIFDRITHLLSFDRQGTNFSSELEPSEKGCGQAPWQAYAGTNPSSL